MMNEVMDVKPEIEKANVLPRTLGIRPLIHKQGEATTELSGVYGGNAGNVWVATFADPQEAQAWILASNTFGDPVNGLVMPEVPVIEVTGGSKRKSS